MKHIHTHGIQNDAEVSAADSIVEKHGHLINKMDAALMHQRLKDKQKSDEHREARAGKTRTTHTVKVVDNRGSEEPARKRPLPRDPETKAVLVNSDRSTRPKKTDKVIVYRTQRQKRENNQQRDTHRGNPCWDQPESE